MKTRRSLFPQKTARKDGLRDLVMCNLDRIEILVSRCNRYERSINMLKSDMTKIIDRGYLDTDNDEIEDQRKDGNGNKI